jgi:hypothetical protein
MPVSHRSGGRLWFGLIILVVGVLFTLDNLGVLDAGEYLRWWPAIIVSAGALRLLRARSLSNVMGGLIVSAIGLLLLDTTVHFLPGRMWDYWPVLMILFGGSIMLRAWQGPGHAGSAEAADSFNAFAMMSGVERKITSQSFRGGDATAIMGGCEIDLRPARIADGPAVIDVFAFWGGIELFVPGDWVVRNEAVPIMGGIVDSRKSAAPDGGKRVMAGVVLANIPPAVAEGTDPSHVLIIRGGALMGGIEIKN